MPLREYKCNKCETVTTILQSMSDNEEKVCKVCGKKMTRLLSNFGFSLNGLGWGKDLYDRANNYGKEK